MPPNSLHDSFRVEKYGGITLVRITRLRGLLDDEGGQAIGKQLLPMAQMPGPVTLILDLSQIECLTSSPLGLFVTLHRKLREAGGNLVLVGVRPEVFEVFEITNLDKFLDVHGGQGSFDDWCFLSDGKVVGPVSSARLGCLLASAEVSPEQPAWRSAKEGLVFSAIHSAALFVARTRSLGTLPYGPDLVPDRNLR